MEHSVCGVGFSRVAVERAAAMIDRGGDELIYQL